MRLRVLMEPRHGATYEQILALARAAEDSGFDGFFRGDHYLGTDAGDPSYLGVVGAPRDVLDRLDQLTAAGADTVYFHLYDVGQRYEAAGPDEVRLLGEEVVSHAR